MSYTPTEWKSGDVVTSEKLNKLENGVAAGGVFTARVSENADDSSLVMDKTWAEVYSAYEQGPVFVQMNDEIFERPTWLPVTLVNGDEEEHEYLVRVYKNASISYDFITDDPDGHPTKGAIN